MPRETTTPGAVVAALPLCARSGSIARISGAKIRPTVSSRCGPTSDLMTVRSASTGGCSTSCCVSGRCAGGLRVRRSNGRFGRNFRFLRDGLRCLRRASRLGGKWRRCDRQPVRSGHRNGRTDAVSADGIGRGPPLPSGKRRSQHCVRHRGGGMNGGFRAALFQRNKRYRCRCEFFVRFRGSGLGIDAEPSQPESANHCRCRRRFAARRCGSGGCAIQHCRKIGSTGPSDAVGSDPVAPSACDGLNAFPLETTPRAFIAARLAIVGSACTYLFPKV